MRKNLYIIFVLIIGFTACDEIPLEEISEIKAFMKIEKGHNREVNTKQMILLEEFSGFKCGNCPEGARIIHDLHEQYPDQIILLTVHAGSFAVPDDVHTYDFRTETGNQLNTDYAPLGYPSAMINRTADENSGLVVLFKSQWAAAINKFLDITPKFGMDIETSFDDTENIITAEIYLTSLEEVSKNVAIAVYIAEDGIINYQLDYTADPNDIYDYEHNNVLRASMNGAYGSAISDDIIPSGTKFKITFNYELPEGNDWNLDNMKLIAFVNDKDGTNNILQAAVSYLNVNPQ